MRKWLIVLSLVLLTIFLPQIASIPLLRPIVVQALEKKSDVKVDVGSLQLSWFGPQIFRDMHFEKEDVTGSFEELRIAAPFWSFSGPFQLKRGSIAYQGGRIEKIEGQIEGNDFAVTGISLEGHLSLKGQIYSRLHFHIQIDIEKLPLILIDQRLDQLLGPTLDLYGTISMDQGRGDIDLKVTSANSKTEIKGLLTEEGIYLKEALKGSIRITPQLSSLLLKEANPRYITSLSSENWVQIDIDPRGFFFPLPYSLEKLKVGDAKIDLGKIRSRNGPSLESILSLLKADKRPPATETDIWVSPFTVQLDEGILQMGRIEVLLANSIELCTWGKVDLVKEHLDMIIGLPKKTLKEAFGIKNLSENYVLKINLRGTTQSPDINKGALVAKVATLIAKDQINKNTVFGSLADLFSSKEDSDIPPPNLPFPWQET